MLHHVCAIPHRSSRVTSFRRFVGAMSGGGRWPRMPGLVRQWRLGRGKAQGDTPGFTVPKGWRIFPRSNLYRSKLYPDNPPTPSAVASFSLMGKGEQRRGRAMGQHGHKLDFAVGFSPN